MDTLRDDRFRAVLLVQKYAGIRRRLESVTVLVQKYAGVRRRVNPASSMLTTCG